MIYFQQKCILIINNAFSYSYTRPVEITGQMFWLILTITPPFWQELFDFIFSVVATVDEQKYWKDLENDKLLLLETFFERFIFLSNHCWFCYPCFLTMIPGKHSLWVTFSFSHPLQELQKKKKMKGWGHTWDTMGDFLLEFEVSKVLFRYS